MTTKLTAEQRKAVEACASQPVLVADEATNKVYYLLNEEAFAHLRGLQSAHDDECQSKLRELIEEGIAVLKSLLAKSFPNCEPKRRLLW
jgi:hypothetical protein